MNLLINHELSTSLLLGKEDETGNEIRHVEYLLVLVPLRFALAFKTPDPFHDYTRTVMTATCAYSHVPLHKIVYMNYVQFPGHQPHFDKAGKKVVMSFP